MSILLPTSIGEAIDKLNILDIKCRRIKDEKRLKFVKEEYQQLYQLLESYVKNNKFYYKILNTVNERLWDIQDDLRLNIIPSTNEATKIVLDENDRRCRIKNKINSKIGSALREQKGYPLKKVLVCSHLGLGDMICMIGIVRYLSTLNDEVYVVCKESYLKNVKLFYQDDDSIKFITCPNNPTMLYKNGSIVDDMKVYTCGLHSIDDRYKSLENNIPEVFYEQMGFDYNLAKEYFYIDYSDYENDDLVKEILQYQYYFVHDNASNINIDLTSNLLKDEILIINPNKNPYPETHHFYNINEKLKSKPLVFFITLFMNAKKIYCIDSSFFNLINFVDTSKVEELFVYSRDNRIYKSFTKFKCLN